MIYKLLVNWVYNLNTEDRKYFLPWYRHILSISLNTGWEIGTEACEVDNVFPSDDLRFNSDT